MTYFQINKTLGFCWCLTNITIITAVYKSFLNNLLIWHLPKEFIQCGFF